MNTHTIKLLLFVSLTANAIFTYILFTVNPAEAPSETPAVQDATSTSASNELLYESGASYPFMRVVDGDTIVVGFDGTTQYVRLIGINAPEVNDPGGPQCYANESTTHLQELARTGLVTLHFDETQGMRDSYGRILAYVELPDGTDLGEKMIEDGYAQEFTVGEGYARQVQYKEAQAFATQEGRGLWGEGVCE